MAADTPPTLSEEASASRSLRRVLRIDAWLSGAVLLLLVVLAGPVGRFAGVPFGVPLGLGLTLVPWVVMVVMVVRRIPPAVGAAAAVVIGNLAGFAAAVVVLTAFPDALRDRAEWALAAVAVGMLALAIFEWIGMRRAR